MQLQTNNLSYTYMKDTPFEREALSDLNITLDSGQFTSIIGHTGSGKSTFIQHMNGLIKPSKGEIKVGDWTISSDTKQKHLFDLRRQVGMVFQFPEHQLFHETVLQDVAYGPINFGLSKVEAERKATEYLELVGIGADLFTRSPFELSGGQMRRVAIAGVLAIEPLLLVLDEPTVGLDPQGQQAMMTLFSEWYKAKEKRSIVLVTHQMEDAAQFSDQVIVMSSGKVLEIGTPEKIFSQVEKLKKNGLSVPESVKLLSAIQSQSGIELETGKFTKEATVESILSFLNMKGSDHDF
ncbi:energy-coupling factor transporter ATPase [Salipaludibacillus sp. CF4.18]|uniref:energy-coupling factor transporter ATPase n=1 Tax=Salipaludibacillus sp. CF4.18 TaxID=3373081 RepID=UPI003EE4C1AF